MDTADYRYDSGDTTSGLYQYPIRTYTDYEQQPFSNECSERSLSPVHWPTDPDGEDYPYTFPNNQADDRSYLPWSDLDVEESSMTETTPKVTFLPVGKSDIHIYPSANSEESPPTTKPKRTKGIIFDKDEGLLRRKKRKNNANNNFVRDDPRNFVRLSTWADEKVYDRTNFLAQPKPYPKGYKDDRQSVYWISKKPPKVPRGGKTISIATPRVEELAKPMYDRGIFKGRLHCHWKDESMEIKRSKLRPSQVDWSRLAAPRLREDPDFRNILQPVPWTALRFQATKRILKLAEPKRAIDSDDFYLWLWKRQPDDEARLTKVKRLSLDKTDLADARVLLKCDLDYTTGKPIEQKIAQIVPTIHWVFKKKARAVIIVSYCGAPNGCVDPTCSLEKLQSPLEEAIGMKVVFLDDSIGAEAVALSEDPEPGYILLLENTLFHRSEQGFTINAEGQKRMCPQHEIKNFREILYNEADVYINDAFTLLTSEHTSNFGPSDKDRAFGLGIKKELAIFNYFVVSPGSALVAVIGGTFAEVGDIVCNFMGKAREILLGGQIAYAFIKTLMDVEIGETSCTEAEMKKIRKMMVRARDTNCVINLPSDLVVQNVKNPGVYYTGYTKDGLDDYYEAVDIGPLTRSCYREIMQRAKKVVWHGMMGSLQDGTSAIACGFAQAHRDGIHTYLADDDTASIYFRFCPQAKVSHITENSEVTMMLLHRKMPKGLSTLSPYRKKIKTRPPKPVFVSNKPTSYGGECMRLENALGRLSIDQLDLKDKTVILRANVNVPFRDPTTLEDNYSLRMVVPTIKYALQSGAFAVVILGSRGDSIRPEMDRVTLRPVAIELARLLNLQVKFVPEVSFTRVKNTLKDCHPGTVLVVENVHTKAEETAFPQNLKSMTFEQAERTAAFCQEFSSIGDVYVNDAFGSLHDKLATTSGCLLRQRACGFLQKSELRYLSTTFMNPPRPFLIILGGNRAKLKFNILRSIMCEVDQVIITGALAFGFLKLAQNISVGNSVYESKLDGEVMKILSLAQQHDVKLYFPVDFVITDKLQGFGQVRQVSASTGVPSGWMAVDLGDKSCSLFRQIIKRSKLILWQGVSGMTEHSEFTNSTHTMLDAVMTATQDKDTKAVSIISGTSLCAFINRVNPDHVGISHVTTGGTAVFSLITDKTLPSLKRLSGVTRRRPLKRMFLDSVEVKDMAILIRANFNIPVELDGRILDSSFLKDLVPTIKYLQRKGAKTITLIGHYGKPRGMTDERFSLQPHKTVLQSLLKQDIQFLEDGVTESNVSRIRASDGGVVFMLENIRFHPEEEGLEMDVQEIATKLPYATIFDYRKTLGKLCDIYVNESFTSLCYCDSSIVGVPAPLKVGGLLMKNELTKFRLFLDNMAEPFLAIVGGHDQSHLFPKLDLTYDLLDKATDLILCGDVAWHFLKVLKGNTIRFASTPIDTMALKLIPRIIRKANVNGINVYLPTDCLINELREVPPEELAPPPTPPPGEPEEDIAEVKFEPVSANFRYGLKGDQVAMDIGPQTLEAFQATIKTAKSIVLLGPAGEFTNKDYRAGCQGILSTIEEARTEEGACALAFGYDTNWMLRTLDAVNKVDHVSMGTRACVDLIKGAVLPGWNSLSPPQPKLLKKLSVETFVVSGARVLLRLDLDIPIVEGTVLDRSKIDAALPTIKFLLDRGAKCVTLLGHRGRPRGFKNAYLTLQPLAQEFSTFLKTRVQFLEEPCSFEARAVLENPPFGSVFLMENLKFYPAEEGKDPLKPTPPEEETTEVQTPEETEEETEAASTPKAEEEKETEDTATVVESTAEMETEAEETEEAEVTTAPVTLDTDTLEEAMDPDNIDHLMYQLMPPKTVEEYEVELTECGDIFINDDVEDIENKLTSMKGFGCKKKMCGLRLKEFIATYDSNAVYDMLGVSSLTQAPKEGDMDQL